MANDSTNSARGSDKVPTVPRCTNLITAQSLKFWDTSRKTPADTQCCRRCQTKPANYQTRQIFMRCQLWKPRIFTPPRTAATRDARIETPPQDGVRGHGQRARRRRETLTTHNTPGPPARRTTPRRTHGAGTEQRGRRTSQSPPARNGR